MKLKGTELNGTYKVEFYDKRFEVYDKNGNRIYVETRYGVWFKWGYDEKGNLIYYENSFGDIIDKRVKELTVKEIEKILGYKIKIIGEKK